MSSSNSDKFPEEQGKEYEQIIEKRNELYDYKPIDERLEELELRMLKREKRILELKIEKRQIEAKLNEQGREKPRESSQRSRVQSDDGLFSS